MGRNRRLTRGAIVIEVIGLVAALVSVASWIALVVLLLNGLGWDDTVVRVMVGTGLIPGLIAGGFLHQVYSGNDPEIDGSHLNQFDSMNPF